jgi:hypothetical protein
MYVGMLSLPQQCTAVTRMLPYKQHKNSRCMPGGDCRHAPDVLPCAHCPLITPHHVQAYCPQQQQGYLNGPGPYPQPYPYQQRPAPLTQVYAPAPVTQLYPAPGPSYPGAAAPYPGPQGFQQYPWQQPGSQQHPPQPFPQQQQLQQQPQWQAQQQQQQPQQPEHEIPIIEASVHIKPSGLPVGTRPVAQPPLATGLPSAALQQQLEQLWVGKVPAAAQGPAAAAVVGSWYHQDTGFLSEVTFMSDGRCYWNRCNTSTGGAPSDAATAIPAASATPSCTAGSSAGCNQEQQQQQQQQSEIWHGIWSVLEGSASRGQLSLVYIVEFKHQQANTQQQQQQRPVSYLRSALEDTLVLDGLAHIKLGPA